MRKSFGQKRSENQKQREASRRSQPPTPHASPSPKASAALSKGITGGRAKGHQGQGLRHHQSRKRSISLLGSESFGLEEEGSATRSQILWEEMGTRRKSALERKDLCLAESKGEPTGISVPRGVLKKRRDSDRCAPRQS